MLLLSSCSVNAISNAQEDARRWTAEGSQPARTPSSGEGIDGERRLARSLSAGAQGANCCYFVQPLRYTNRMPYNPRYGATPEPMRSMNWVGGGFGSTLSDPEPSLDEGEGKKNRPARTRKCTGSRTMTVSTLSTLKKSLLPQWPTPSYELTGLIGVMGRALLSTPFGRRSQVRGVCLGRVLASIGPTWRHNAET